MTSAFSGIQKRYNTPFCNICKSIATSHSLQCLTSCYSDTPVSELSLELLLLQVVLPALLEQGHTRLWLKSLVRGWCVGVAWLLGIRSYLLGDVPLGQVSASHVDAANWSGQSVYGCIWLATSFWWVYVSRQLIGKVSQPVWSIYWDSWLASLYRWVCVDADDWSGHSQCRYCWLELNKMSSNKIKFIGWNGFVRSFLSVYKCVGDVD